ncbi:hypothetical protein OIU84_012849 [Salix udensis]|uniref:Uncharacterized protein n=1 Tax=Salix udensis TaxID=889485 RepID=A0AAD6JIM9_9ROSI|nr:hypothetical protein OIU84_012849 [Salix udensis]
MKPSLDDARKFRKSVLELGESSGHARDAVGKQTHLLDSLWELLKTPLPSGGTCGGTSASTDKDACPPLELSVAAMKPDGSVTTESFKPCQLLPEQWTPLECRGSTSYSTEVLEGVPNPMESAMSLNGSVMSGSFKPCESLPDADKLAFINKLKELYIASVAQHAQEKIRHAQEMAAIEARHTAAKDRHAQEMAAAKDRHDQEMAPANDRHDQEMAAAKERHDQEMAATKDRHAQEMAAAKERHDQEMAAVKTEYLVMLLYLFIFLFILLKNMALRLMNLLRSLTHAQY